VTGALSGNGVTTLVGGGTNNLTNTWTLAINGSSVNGIVAKTGTVSIAACTLVITNTAGAAPNEWIVVDYSAATAHLLGSAFTNVVGLPAKWMIQYSGTGVHPNCVVLQYALRGTVFVAH